jgi:hypothetical protein
MPYIDYVKQEFNIVCEIAGNSKKELRKNENNYYSKNMKACYNMRLDRMDSCAGIIISVRELMKFAIQC